MSGGAGQFSRYSDVLRAGRPGFDSRQGQEIVLCSTASRPALWPTQPPIQLAPGALYLALKWRGREAYHTHLHLEPRSGMMELHLHSPVRLHDITRVTLPCYVRLDLVPSFQDVSTHYTSARVTALWPPPPPPFGRSTSIGRPCFDEPNSTSTNLYLLGPNTYYNLYDFVFKYLIAQTVQRLATSWTTDGSEFDFFLFSIASRPVLGPIHLLPNVYQGLFPPGVKRQRREADHSPPTSAEVKKTRIYKSTPPYVFMVQSFISLLNYTKATERSPVNWPSFTFPSN
jgi:hypothetical protein